MCLLCFEDLEVLEKALGGLGGSSGGLLGALGGPWQVPDRSLGIPGGSWWVLVGSLGPHTRQRCKNYYFLTFPKGLRAPWGLLGGFLLSLGTPLRVLGGAQGKPLEVLGGARGIFLDPWGGLGGPCGAIGGLMKTVKNICFLF